MMNKRSELFMLLFAGLYLLTTIDIVAVANGQIMMDFRSFYFAVEAFARHGNIYDYQYLESISNEYGLSGNVFPYLYPPSMVFYLATFAKLGVTKSAIIWVIYSILFTLIVFLASIHLALSLINLSGQKTNISFFILSFLLLIILPFSVNVKLGQVNIFILALIVFSLLQGLINQRYFLAGFILAPAVLVKIIPLVVLFYFVINKRYRFLLGFIVGIIIFTTLTLFDSHSLQAWKNFSMFSDNMAYGGTVPGLFAASNLHNFSLSGFIARFDDDVVLHKTMPIFLLAAMGFTLLFKHVKLADQSKQLYLLLPFSILMIIASPFTYLHHVIYIYPGLLVTVLFALQTGNRLAVVIIFMLAIFISIPWPSLYGVLQIDSCYVTSLNLYGLILLFFVGLMVPMLGKIHHNQGAPYPVNRCRKNTIISKP